MTSLRLIACSKSPEPIEDWIQEIVNQAKKKRGVEYGGPIPLPRRTIQEEEYFIRMLTFSSDSSQRITKVVDIDPPDEVESKIEMGRGKDEVEINDLLPIDERVASEEELTETSRTPSLDNETRTAIDQKEEKQRTNRTPSQNPTERANMESRQEKAEIDELRKRAHAEATENVEGYSSTANTTQYTRSSAIREYVLARADGACEGCELEAPFLDKEGNPYLQAHHVHELSQGGADTPKTVIALCPNCHYRVHHGRDGDKYNSKLIEKLEKLEP